MLDERLIWLNQDMLYECSSFQSGLFWMIATRLAANDIPAIKAARSLRRSRSKGHRLIYVFERGEACSPLFLQQQQFFGCKQQLLEVLKARWSTNM